MHPDSPPSKGVNHPNPSRPFSEARTDKPALSSFPNTKYPLPPLQNPKEEIRLLRFQPADTETTVGVELTAHRLDALPVYHAISYTWGAPSETATISINGQLTTVRRNCYYSLWQVRSHYPNEYIWIDSICIDQTSISEKNHQVQMMGQIYANANSVLACVGPHDAGSEQLVQRRVMAEPEEYTMKDRAWMWKILKAFWHRPYWERLWIVQELELSKRAIFLCGEHILEFADLSLMPWRSDWSDHLPDILGHVLQVIRGTNTKTDLWRTIWFHLKERCADPRDHVYAVLSIYEPSPLHDPIMVDYSITAPALALDVLKRVGPVIADTSYFGRQFLDILNALGLCSATGLSAVMDFRASIYRDGDANDLDDLVLAACWDSYPITKELPGILQSMPTNCMAAKFDADLQGRLTVQPLRRPIDWRPPGLRLPNLREKHFVASSKTITQVDFDALIDRSVYTLTARVTSAARPGDLLLRTGNHVHGDLGTFLDSDSTTKRSFESSYEEPDTRLFPVGGATGMDLDHNHLASNSPEEFVVARWIGPGVWKAIGQAHITACTLSRLCAPDEAVSTLCFNNELRQFDEIYSLTSAEAVFLQWTHCFALSNSNDWTEEQRASTLDEIASFTPPSSYFYVPVRPPDLDDCRSRLEPEWQEKFCHNLKLQESRSQHVWFSEQALNIRVGKITKYAG